MRLDVTISHCFAVMAQIKWKAGMSWYIYYSVKAKCYN